MISESGVHNEVLYGLLKDHLVHIRGESDVSVYLPHTCPPLVGGEGVKVGHLMEWPTNWITMHGKSYWSTACILHRSGG